LVWISKRNKPFCTSCYKYIKSNFYVQEILF